MVAICMLSLIIGFVSSLKAFRLDILHYKVISTVMIIDLIAESLTLVSNRFHLSNMPIYSFTLLGEFWLYGYYYSLVIVSKRVRSVIRIYLWILPVVWILLVTMIFHANKWNSHFYVVGAVMIVVFSACYYYQLFTAQKLVKLRYHFEFWIATALILYYACTIPYFGIMNYLNSNFIYLAQLMLPVVQSLNVVFYLMIAYAFIWAIPIKRSS